MSAKKLRVRKDKKREFDKRFQDSPYVPLEKVLQEDDVPRDNLKIEPKSERQKQYFNLLKQHDQVFATGSPGTGKTYVALMFAAGLLKSRKIKKIVLTRPNISSSVSLGAFPGTLEEKFSGWVAPMLIILRKALGDNVVECAVKNGNIELVPFELMRGRSFEDSFVIIDEAQSTTVEEMKTFLTRIGEGSRLAVLGDLDQSDLKGVSGLKHALELIGTYGLNVGTIHFTVDDIVRSDICKQWIIAFQKAAK